MSTYVDVIPRPWRDNYRAERRIRSLLALGGVIRRSITHLHLSKAKAGERIVVVKAPRGFVPRVDPKTRQATDVPQQFALHADGKLTPLRDDCYIISPEIVNVGRLDYR